MSRLRKLDDEIMKNNAETRVALLEQSIGHINETLIRIEKKMDFRFDEQTKRFNEIDKHLDKVDGRIEKINDRLWSNFLWLTSIMMGLTGTAFSVMAKGFHWL